MLFIFGNKKRRISTELDLFSLLQICSYPSPERSLCSLTHPIQAWNMLWQVVLRTFPKALMMAMDMMINMVLITNDYDIYKFFK